MTVLKKPMLAGKVEEESKLVFPCIVSVKLDGIRCMADGGKPMSRSMKLIPNLYVQKFFQDNAEVLQGLDGELIVGEPNLPTTYNTTVSAIMRVEGEPDFTYWVFDRWDRGDIGHGDLSFQTGAHQLDRVKILSHGWIDDPENLYYYEIAALRDGYEGVMVRSPSGRYKQGRSSFKEGYLLKLKRHLDAEAVIEGFEEKMHNENEAFTNELGRTARSSHKENQVGTDTLGAMIVRGVNGDFKDVTFKVGTGFTAAQRADYWGVRSSLIGKVITYKYFPIGVKDAPRHPVFKNFRDAIDMDAAA